MKIITLILAGLLWAWFFRFYYNMFDDLEDMDQGEDENP